jgi:DNA-binding response OmpR family regulator
MDAPERDHEARFGDFEADFRASELRKNGIRLKLQNHPFLVLLLLIEHPGDVVTREELRKKHMLFFICTICLTSGPR